MRTDAFDFDLPEELIAQTPALPRESCRLLVAHRNTGAFEHKTFTDILDYLRADDLLVVNDTKVMPARLLGTKVKTGCSAELLLLQRLENLELTDSAEEQYWEALVKPGKRLKPGSSIEFEGMRAEIIDWALSGGKGQRIIRLYSTNGKSVAHNIQNLGKLPLPPYIKSYAGDTSFYQTVYAREQNSAAAPTAGLHFSKELLEKAQDKGVNLTSVCLEIGLDTFRTVKDEFIHEHSIHSETYTVNSEAVAAIQKTRESGGRVVAVGTTAVRALESAALRAEREGESNLLLCPVQSEQTKLYIVPGYTFNLVDVLLTNFHTPRSTLLMLVAALMGYDFMKAAYQSALQERYRFLSFGDAMLIL